MADVNERKTDFEMDIQPEESCEGCEVPVTNTCQSCGMPMMSPEHHGGGDEDNDYCIQCCHPDGILKSKLAAIVVKDPELKDDPDQMKISVKIFQDAVLKAADMPYVFDEEANTVKLRTE